MGPLWERNKGLFVLGKAFHQVTAEKAFHPRGGLKLPTMPRLTEPLAPKLPTKEPQNLPLLSTPELLWELLAKTGLTIVDSAQLPDHHRGHIWVSVINHGQTVSPAGPKKQG